MRKNLRILLSLMLVFAMSMSISAASFKDVPANEWYAQYVNKAADAGIIKGYDDNTFRPKGNISFTEISSLLGNLVNVSEAEMQAANSKFGKELDEQLNIVKNQGNKGIDWARPAILKCLQAGVYDMTALKGAVQGFMLLDTNPGKRPFVSRSNTASFFADALKVNVAAASLPYKDTAQIPANIQTKVQALINIGVLSKEGDGNGYFNPNSAIDRASIAKMITIAMDHIKANGNNSNTTVTIPVANTAKTLKGKVAGASINSQPATILINFGSTNQAVYINHTTVVTIDGKPALYDKIEEGMSAEVTYNTGTGYATKADFKSEESVLKGKISDILSTYRFEIEYEKGSIVNNTIELDFRDAEITLDGKKATVSDLDKDYEVKITMLGSTVKKVEAKRSETESDGTFYQFGYSRGEYYVDIYPNERNSRIKSAKIEGRYVYINDKKIDCEDLVKSSNRNRYIVEGTPIKLKLNRHNEVTEIKTVFAEIKDGIIQGYIYQRPRRGDDYIRIAPTRNSSSRDTIDLKIDRYTKFYISKTSRNDMEELRQDDFVRITMRGGYAEKVEIVDYDSRRETKSNVAYGVILEMKSSSSDIEILIDSEDRKQFKDWVTVFKRDRNIKYYIDGKEKSESDFRYIFDRAYDKDDDEVKFEWYKDGDNYYITRIEIIDK